MRCGIAAVSLAVCAATTAVAQDDHGDDSHSASLLPIGGTVPGRLDSRSDIDAFRLDILGQALIQIRTSGQTDTEGELLDGADGQLMLNDNSGPGDNFGIEYDLAPGVYYVHVTGAAGEYAINARLGARATTATPSARPRC